MIGFLIMLNVILVILCITFLIKLRKATYINKAKICLINLCIILSLVISLNSLYIGLTISGEKIILEYDLSNNQKYLDIDKTDYKNRLSLNDLITESLNDIDKVQNKLSVFTLLSFIFYLIGFFYKFNISKLKTKNNT